MSTPDRADLEPLDEGHRALRESIGVHALGHLDGPEAAEIDAHLATCDACREEYDHLAALAGPLGALSTAPGVGAGADPVPLAATTHPGDAGFAQVLARIRDEQTEAEAGTRRLVPLTRTGPLPVVRPDDTARPGSRPPHHPDPTGLDAPTVATTAAPPVPTSPTPPTPGGDSGPADATVTALRPRRRPLPRLAAAAAVVLIALAVGVGLGAGLGPGSGPSGETVAVSSLDPAVSASADLIAHTWGVEVDLSATGFRTGEAYRVEVLDTAGRPVTAGAFIGTGDQQMRCRLNSALLRPDATGFVVTDAAGNQVISSRFT